MADVEITVVKFRSYLMPNGTVCDATWRTLRYPGANRDVHEIYWTPDNPKETCDSMVTYDPVQAGLKYQAMCDHLADQLLGISSDTSKIKIPDNYGSW